MFEHSISNAELQLNTPYSIVKAARNSTRIGPAISITIRDDSDRLAHVFVPRRCLSLFTDDILKINDGETKFQVIYDGKCEKLGAFSLSLTTADIYIYIYIYIYRVSQEGCARLREGVPYVKVYRYNPKHLYPKLNGYGDNGQRKVWSSGGSMHCTCQLRALSMLRR